MSENTESFKENDNRSREKQELIELPTNTLYHQSVESCKFQEAPITTKQKQGKPQ